MEFEFHYLSINRGGRKAQGGLVPLDGGAGGKGVLEGL